MSFGPPEFTDDIEIHSDELYGVICRMQAGVVEECVPDGFKTSAAKGAAVAYLRQIAGELMRLPHRYGYDPQAVYTVLVQTWDRALSPARSLAFGRRMTGQEQVRLMPDAYYIAADGYANLQRSGLRTPSWSARSSHVVWRGSVTGQGVFASPADIPRVKLALACRAMGGADVALTGVHETMRSAEPTLSDYLVQENLIAPSWPIRNFAYYKHAIDIDGHANAWGLLEKFILGCCVLKVATPFEQWFYPRMHAWEHYVPINSDLSDLADAIAWCRENEAHCEWIAANGYRLAVTCRPPAELARSCLEFMAVAQASRPQTLSNLELALHEG